MNREIKFRTWDTQNKEFSEWTNRDPFFCTSNGKIFFWERTRKEDGSFSGDIVMEDTGNRFVLQQFTGMTDKNGQDVYEGDILLGSWCGGYFGERKQNKKVRWKIVHSSSPYKSGLEIEIVDMFTNLKYRGIPKIEDCEIIGNICEHPELLK